MATYSAGDIKGNYMIKEKCRFCSKEIKFELHANFTVYCPFCFKHHRSECEYGFGPVTPFYFSVGKLLIAKIYEDNSNTCFLESPYFEKKALRGVYLDAVSESDKIMDIMIIQNKEKILKDLKL
jgi:hypothetical protein